MHQKATCVYLMLSITNLFVNKGVRFSLVNLRSLVLGVCMLQLMGCSISSLMFYPFKQLPVTPDKVGLQYEKVNHESADGTKLVSWWLPSAKVGAAKGTILYLHGNAQNISYHQFNVSWLPSQGYNVLMLGYRQFGESEGIAKLPHIFLDVHAGLDWIIENNPSNKIFILGQSMGASLSVFGLASYAQSDKVDGVILDAVFDSYPGIAAHAMSQNWFTWPLQLIAYSMGTDYDPELWIKQWPDNMPLLMMHSPQDQVIPYNKGRRVFELAREPKQWVENTGPHIATFKYLEMRQSLLKFIAQ